MRQSIIAFLHRAGLYNIAHQIYYGGLARLWRIYGNVTSRNDRYVHAYAAKHGVKKLHLGCGNNYLDSWINTDFRPNAKRIFLDITKRFTFSDNTFDYLFTEHVIEHVPYQAGKNLIQESFRILKPGGTLRIVTPDVNFLIGLYQDQEKQIHKDYTKWNADLFVGDKAPHTPLSVVNNFVRDWGHVYIYDIPTLRAEMERAGFIDIKTPALNESEHAALKNIEHDSRHPPGFLALESLVIEGTKP